MNLFLIQKYIQKLTKNNIDTFAKNQGTILEEYELETIYYYIKNRYIEFIKGEDKKILDELKSQVKPTTYNKIEELYNIYKNKISF